MASKDLVFRFMGTDSGAGREFDKMIGKSASLEKAIGGMAAGFAAAGVAIGVESVRAAAKFQQSMTLIETQAGRSKSTVDAWSKSVLAMSGSVATAPDELAKGLYHLASTGMSAAKTMEALKVAAQGAKLGGADLESVTNALNATIVSGIKGSKDFNSAMGALNATVGAGDMSMQDLADAMSTGVLTTAKNFGVSLNSVGAALAVFGDNNIRGADAATKLSQSITYLEKPAAGADKVLKTIGLSTRQLRSDMGSGGLGKTLADLHQHLVKAGDTGTKLGPILLDVFGRKPANAINTLLGEYQRFQDKQEEVHKGSKNFASDWGAYTQTFGYSWDRAKTSFESMTIQIGTKLLPTATKAMNWIGTTGVGDLEKFSGWVSRNKTPIEDIAKLLAGIAAFRFATGTLSKIPGLLGGGRGALGGGTGGVIGSAKPVPVFVTNEGFGGGGGLPGTGGGGGGKLRGLRGLTRAIPLVGTAVVGAELAHDYTKHQNDASTQRLIKAAQTPTGRIQLQNEYVAGMSALPHQGGFQAAATKGMLAQIDTALKSVHASLDLTDKGFKNLGTSVRHSANDIDNAKSQMADFRSMTAAQRRAVSQTITQFGRIPGAMKQLAAQAQAAGLSIGSALDAGVTIGIQQGQGKIQIVSTSVIDGVRHSMAKAADMHSPSKMTAYIGRMLAEGLGVGMKQGEAMALQSAKSVMSKVLTGLGTVKGDRSGMASGISSNLQGGGSLSNMPLGSLTTAFGTSYTAAPTVAGMLAFERSYLAREHAFARNLGVARKKGLSAQQIAVIAQMGLDSGGPIAAALAGGTSGQNHALSTVTAQVTAAANQIGKQASGAVYDRQVALLEEAVRLLKEQVHATHGVGTDVRHALTTPHAAKTLATSHTRARRAK